MRIDILTLFPEMFENVLGHSILKIARKRRLFNTIFSIYGNMPKISDAWMTGLTAADQVW